MSAANAGTGGRTSSLKVDMEGKTVFVGGVADSTGYGWAISKACADAGAKVLLGTWPPVMPIFKSSIDKNLFADDSKLSDGSTMKIEKV
jgi:enoyl-[acyl-carrier protein] reductase I